MTNPTDEKEKWPLLKEDEAIDALRAALGDRLLAGKPISREYVTAVVNSTISVIRSLKDQNFRLRATESEHESKLAEAEAKVEAFREALETIRDTHNQDCGSIIFGRGDNWPRCSCHSKIANEALAKQGFFYDEMSDEINDKFFGP